MGTASGMKALWSIGKVEAMKEKGKSIVLYDVGGAIILVFLGIPFGSVFDYLWNLLVLSLALPRLPGELKMEISKSRRLAFCFFITLLGIIIDWAYFELTWDTDFGKFAVWAPAMSQALQLAWLLLGITNSDSACRLRPVKVSTLAMIATLSTVLMCRHRCGSPAEE